MERGIQREAMLAELHRIQADLQRQADDKGWAYATAVAEATARAAATDTPTPEPKNISKPTNIRAKWNGPNGSKHGTGNTDIKWKNGGTCDNIRYQWHLFHTNNQERRIAFGSGTADHTNINLNQQTSYTFKIQAECYKGITLRSDIATYTFTLQQNTPTPTDTPEPTATDTPEATLWSCIATDETVNGRRSGRIKIQPKIWHIDENGHYYYDHYATNGVTESDTNPNGQQIVRHLHGKYTYRETLADCARWHKLTYEERGRKSSAPKDTEHHPTQQHTQQRT